MIELDKLIVEASKSGDHTRLEVIRSIKNEKLKHNTAKNAKPYDDAVELSILNRMVKELKGDIEQFEKGNRSDLVEKANAEIAILSEFIPKGASEDEINAKLNEFTNGTMKAQKSDMGKLIGRLKGAFPSTDGSLIASCVKKIIE